MPTSLESACRSQPEIEGIVGDSSWARDIRAKVPAVAGCPSNVLITGPTGTGKEVIARAIHDHSPRARMPFIPVDCAAVTGTLFASHIFGHLKGAFTGAGYAALGSFRAAAGGTVFLDEIGELEADMQTKLLRVLQQRAVTPLGSHEEVGVDVRVIAATNRDLSREMAEGRFREDLYYRLHVISLRTTPLKDRPEDIEPLARHFLDKLAVLHGLAPKRLSDAALDRLRRFDWPGNVRQLENVLECATFSTGSELVDADAILVGEGCVPPAVAGGPESALCAAARIAGDWLTIAEVEREHIRRTLERARYNQCEAARLLGVERHQLARKIRKYGLDIAWVKPVRAAARTA
jgi:DNA-binding NtrC family response regulator